MAKSASSNVVSTIQQGCPLCMLTKMIPTHRLQAEFINTRYRYTSRHLTWSHSLQTPPSVEYTEYCLNGPPLARPTRGKQTRTKCKTCSSAFQLVSAKQRQQGNLSTHNRPITTYTTQACYYEREKQNLYLSLQKQTHSGIDIGWTLVVGVGQHGYYAHDNGLHRVDG